MTRFCVWCLKQKKHSKRCLRRVRKSGLILGKNLDIYAYQVPMAINGLSNTTHPFPPPSHRAFCERMSIPCSILDITELLASIQNNIYMLDIEEFPPSIPFDPPYIMLYTFNLYTYINIWKICTGPKKQHWISMVNRHEICACILTRIACYPNRNIYVEMCQFLGIEMTG